MRFSYAMAFRAAIRELLRRKFSAILISVLVAVPIATISAVLTMDASSTISVADRADREFGTAEYRVPVTLPADGSAEDRLSESRRVIGRAFGPGAQAAALVDGRVAVRAERGELPMPIHVMDTESVLTQRMFVTRSGMTPHASDEIMVSEAAAATLRVSIGEQVVLPLLGRPMRVVGIGLDQLDATQAFAVLPVSSGAATDLVAHAREAEVRVAWLVTPAAGVTVAKERLGGAVAASRGAASAVPRGGAGSVALWLFIAGFAEVLAVLAAIFASMARRRRHSYRRLVDRKQDLATAFAIGFVAGSIPVLFGLVTGIGLAVVLRWGQYGRLCVPAGRLAAIAGLSVLAVTLCGGLTGRPANGSRSGPAVAAVLAGVLGCIALGRGAASGQPTMAAAGAGAIVLACGLLMVWLLRRWGTDMRRGPLALRLAVRAAAAVPVRQAALIVAVAGIATCATTSIFYLTTGAHLPKGPVGSALFTDHQAVPDAAVRRAAERLGATGVAEFRRVTKPDSDSGRPAVVRLRDPADVCADRFRGSASRFQDCVAHRDFKGVPTVAAVDRRAAAVIIGRELTPAEAAAFDGGTVLVLHPALLDSAGNAVLTATPPPKPDGRRAEDIRIPLPGLAIADEQYAGSPMALVSASVARSNGLDTTTGDYLFLFRSPHSPDSRAEKQAASILTQHEPELLSSGWLDVERGDAVPERIVTLAETAAPVLAGLYLLIVLTGIGLSSTELRDGAVDLRAIEASSRTCQAISAWQSGMTSAVGSFVGLALAPWTARAILGDTGTGLSLWYALACGVALVPLCAALGWMCAYRPPKVGPGRGRPRRVAAADRAGRLVRGAVGRQAVGLGEQPVR
ncbi:hypothetical protein [Nocardia arthritidis]|uniref:Uncharacterized protein n=1 Tax=Nocardia arthritidis TaxID=228602 RepID=A0A6G9YH77_9NOCA|nr:hypothetical protein [Nocardia arthritidis]QIS12548.1 hypothetical protein F5544_23445 [Nocardia arthritidis]